jgi:hypothetical protein
MGGSSFFYELWWIYVGGGCKTGGAHWLSTFVDVQIVLTESSNS